ncbi:MAG: radical SAM protein [Myxococcota bacterium]
MSARATEGADARKAARKARVEGLLAGRPRTGPQTVHFDLANACNTRCTTCWHHSPHLDPARAPTAAWKKQQLGLDAFRASFDDLVALGGLEAVILSGMGDPTLNDALYDMVAHARRADVHVTIITNALRLDVPRLMAAVGAAPGAATAEALDILASICGVSEPVWQAFHAHPRADGWATLQARLADFRAAGFRPKHVQVINAQNFHELVAMIDFAAEHRAKSVAFKLASLAHGTEAVALGDADKRRLADELVPAARARAEALGVETDLAAFARQIHEGSDRTAPIEEIGCFMGYLYARVTVLGEVLFCCNTNVPVGDLARGDRLAELWTGPAWQARRDDLRAGRYFTGCDQCGKLKQNLKWSDKLRAGLGESAFLPLIGRAPGDASGQAPERTP